MIQHMNLVFQADGLTVGEGAFLMACANHTDDKGYVIAHMQQLADEAHMKLRAAQTNRARLEKRKLLKAGARFSPKNNAQIANLFRINLDLLASMQRRRKDYGPTLIEELTFDDPSQENPSSDPHADFASPPADSAPPPAKSAGAGGAESAPLLLPSSLPSSLSGPAGLSGDGSRQDEREAAAPEDKPVAEAAAAGNVSAPRGDDGKQTAEADVVQMLAGLPGQVSKAAAQRLVPLVLAALGEGWTLVALRAHLARLCDPERVRYAPAVYEKHLRELPAPPASTGLRGAAADMCEQHPVFPAGDCTPCRLAQMKARRGDVDGGSGPLPLDVTAVLDRVRAGLGAGGGQR